MLLNKRYCSLADLGNPLRGFFYHRLSLKEFAFLPPALSRPLDSGQQIKL